jgi:hypothetical protein
MKRIVGQVVNGKFVTSKPKEINNREHSMHRQYVRDRMREEYAKDIVQPWKYGQANEEFIEAWGKNDARKYFNIKEKEIE